MSDPAIESSPVLDLVRVREIGPIVVDDEDTNAYSSR